MALSARYAKASDTFDSSIDGNWTNGPGAAANMQWVTGGYVQNGSTVADCAMCYTGTTFGDNQYAKVVINALTGGSYGSIWGVVRMDSADGSCYIGQVRRSGEDPRFYIIDIDDTFVGFELANGPAGAGFSAGDYIVMEASGSSLELYAVVAGGSETSRCTTTDTTHTTGYPGCGANNDSTGFQITSWEGGDDIQPGPTITDQPDDASVNAGQTVNFTVAATGTGSLTYQWQSRLPGGTPTNIGGATSSSYTTPALGFDDDNRLYRCRVTDTVTTTDSREARVRVANNLSSAWLRA